MIRSPPIFTRTDTPFTYTTLFRSQESPHGRALRAGWLYVADTERAWRYRWQPGQRRAAGKPEPVTPDGALGDSGGHWTRNIAFGPEGSHFFVAIGSRGNLAVEEEPPATIKRFASDGSRGQIYARGLPNPGGIRLQPDTGESNQVLNWRHAAGDELAQDHLNI